MAASLNYQLSGIPYWSEDIGGFFRPDGQHTDPGYAALLTRWFQFGVFTPIFRVHGTNGNTELWEFGEVTQHLQVSMMAGECSFVSSTFRAPNTKCSSELCRKRQGELQALSGE